MCRHKNPYTSTKEENGWKFRDNVKQGKDCTEDGGGNMEGLDTEGLTQGQALDLWMWRKGVLGVDAVLSSQLRARNSSSSIVS